MTPPARLQAAIEILGELNGTELPADKLLQNWFRARRYAGSKDRAAIAERVYDVLRHRASFAWRMASAGARACVLASLLAEGQDEDAAAAMFSGETYAPAPLTDEERRAIAAIPTHAPPKHVRGEYPEWLEPELERAFGDALLDEMQAMIARAPVDLRVNTLRARRDDMLVGLRSLGVKAEPTPHAPHGIRIASAKGLGILQHTQFFQTGAFEFQDEASQIAALLCGAKPGERVLDLAAGAGGKSLALAAAMENKGEILAFDDNLARLKPLAPRARRAGAHIIRIADKRGGPLWGNGRFDAVLADVPCSGSGTWRRNPELKWRLTPERLQALVKTQAVLIGEGARHTQAGGRLIYATCSVLRSENDDIVETFLLQNKDFRVIPAAVVWRMSGYAPAPGVEQYFRASPGSTATDGFFACIMQKTGQSHSVEG